MSTRPTPDADASIETSRFIEAYKKRPEYPREAEAAEQTLAALGIHPSVDGMADAEALLEHWRGCISKLLKPDFGASDGTSADGEDPGLPEEQRK